MSGRCSAIYEGAVVHRRLRPVRHRLRYRLTQFLIDLDEAPGLDRALRLFGHNRPALFALRDRDHGAGEDRPLRPQIEAVVRSAGLEPPAGPMRLLASLRTGGHLFNPLSLFYCHQPSGELAAVVLEVTNTFCERHYYVAEARGGRVRAACAKAFFVSPLLPMAMTYDFRLAAPGEAAMTTIVARGPDRRPWLSAAFQGERRPLTDAALAAAFVRRPLMTWAVSAAIRLEALRLVGKGLGWARKPAPPHASVTLAG